MKKLIYILIPFVFFSCNKDNFDKEHSQHIVGKWKWVKTEIHSNSTHNNLLNTYTPTNTGKTLEIEFKKNGTTKFVTNDCSKTRYLKSSSSIFGNSFFSNPFSNQLYYGISTRFTKPINSQENFSNYIPESSLDSLYSSYHPSALHHSEGAIDVLHAKSIFIKI